LVCENCRRYAIDAWIGEGGEVTLAHKPGRVNDLAEEQAYLKATFGESTELLSRGDLKQRGISVPAFYGGLWNPTGFSIHPLNYARGLARAAAASGAHIHSRSRVIRWEERDGVHILSTTREGCGPGAHRRHERLYARGRIGAATRTDHAGIVQYHRDAAAQRNRTAGTGLDIAAYGF
jgi:glycine/D-amino acid oxidase-like deaminating enzyme